MTTLRDLLLEQMKDLYHAENQLIKALPRLAKKASAAPLREAIEEHLEQTRGQVDRLDKAFEALGEKAKPKKCEAIEGLLREAQEITGTEAEPAVLDAGIIAAAQKVEHYEIASYGCVATWAKQLELDEVASLLEDTLDEEKTADERLTEIAENEINVEAAGDDSRKSEGSAGAGAWRGRSSMSGQRDEEADAEHEVTSGASRSKRASYAKRR